MDTQNLNMFKRMFKEALLATANSGVAQNVAPYTARDVRAAFAPNLFNKAPVPADDLTAHAAFGLKSVGPITKLAAPREIVLSVEVIDQHCRPGDFDFLLRMRVKESDKALPGVKYSASAGKLVEVSTFTKQVRAAFGLTPGSMHAFLSAACDCPDRRARQNEHMKHFWC